MSPKVKGQFLFGGVYNGEDYRYFTDRLAMLKFITRPLFRSSIWVAHNLEYDLNRIFLNHPKLERFYLGSRLLFAKYPVDQDHYIYFYDTFNLSFTSVEKLGKMVNIKKSSDYFSDKITAKGIEANKKDCEIIWKYLIRFQTIINNLGGNLKPSLASISLDIYRRKYMSPEWEYFKIPQSITEQFREGYYGGRTEVFNFNRQDQVYYYDINSSYPSAMLNQFPLLNTWVNKPNIEKEGITYAKISIPNIYFPPLPYRSDGKLLFPIGTWTGHWYNNELRAIKEIYPQVKIKILSGIHYTKSDFIFKKFIEDFYQARQKSQSDAEDYIYKIMMNALYGKFATKNFLEKFTGNNKETINSIPISSNVIWSGMITAYARANLLKLLIKSNSVYCDTDSTISHKEINCNRDLGGIGLKAIYKRFQAYNPKHYEYQEGKIMRQKIKGIPSKVIRDGNSFTYEQPIKFKSAMRRKIPLWAWISVTKNINFTYDKRLTLPNGDTAPLLITNGKIKR
jgi:hypothetical protein